MGSPAWAVYREPAPPRGPPGASGEPLADKPPRPSVPHRTPRRGVGPVSNAPGRPLVAPTGRAGRPGPLPARSGAGGVGPLPPWGPADDVDQGGSLRRHGRSSGPSSRLRVL